MVSCGNEFIFTWKIENFSCLPLQPGEKLESAEFIVDTVKKSKWCLWIYPKGDTDGESKDYISLFLCNAEYESTSYRISYKLRLESTEVPFKIPTEEERHEDNFGELAMGDWEVIPIVTLYENRDIYLPQDVLTVTCFIWPCDEVNDKKSDNTPATIFPDPFRRHCLSTTRIQVQRKSLNWPIREINKHIESGRETSTFLKSALRYSPTLKLIFCLKNDSDKLYAQIYILPMCALMKKKLLFVKCKVTILTAKKIYQDSIEDSHLFGLQREDIWCLPPFLKTIDLTDENYIYADDTLFLQCDFAFTCPDTENHVESPQYIAWPFEVKKHTKVNQLCCSIHHLYTQETFCDVTLNVGGKTFPAHKIVLSARSPVFCAMFQSDMKEKETRIVDIPDVDAETTDRFMRFLYTEIIDDELTTEEVIKLYKAADKYQVDLLRQQCSLLLLSTLSVTSVCEVLTLVDTHQDHFLMTAVNNFIHCHFSEILNSEEWKDFMDRCPSVAGFAMFNAWKTRPFL